MDDVALITGNHKDLQEMLNITYDVANKYHIYYLIGMAKSKILKIGKTKEKTPLYLGNNELEYVQTYKYLGETMNNKGTIENHIKETTQKTEAAYQTILAIMGNKYYNNIELETAWKLLETRIQPIITYGGESWNINKKEQKSLNRIQEISYDVYILMVPQSTPTDTLYIEMLNITYDVANKYHIEFGMAKSKILKIGKTKEKPPLYLGKN